MLFSKRKRIIKKAVSNTVSAFAERTPKIYSHFFYGDFDINPKSLAVLYLFETDAELETAKESGLCSEIKEQTIKNLISLGYPEEAIVLDASESDFSVGIAFTTQEDVDKKADGDFHLYFQ